MANPKVKNKKVVSKAGSKAKLKAKKIKLPIARVFFRAEFNNSIVTLTDLEGKVIAWASAGKAGFKGSKKSTPFAAQKAVEDILEKLKTYETSSVHLVIKGAGMGRDAFLRAIQATSLQVESIKDVTGFAFGGARAKKKRRV
jgi:small subunit ribosomal protein S11